jgi:AcrR family transcriptional regulator
MTTAHRPVRSRRERRTRGDDRERAILETFELLLEKRPYHEISVDDLASGAGISRPTFYFYFPSKEAVLLTLLDRMVDETRGRIGQTLERFSDDPAGALRAGITAVYEAFGAHRAVSVAAADILSTSDEARGVWERVMEEYVETTAAIIEAERARGAAPDGVPARDLAIALNRMNERVFNSTFAGQAPAVAEERLVDVLVTVWLGAVYGGGVPN